MKTVKVVAAIIERETPQGIEILSTQRGYGAYKGWWEFPGGKPEEGETPKEALAREIREELAVEIDIKEFFMAVEYDYPEFHLVMDCFRCRILQGEPKLLEHEAARWLPVGDLRQVNWLPADVEVIEAIEERFIGTDAQNDI